jgi:hypothetical protein
MYVPWMLYVIIIMCKSFTIISSSSTTNYEIARAVVEIIIISPQDGWVNLNPS